MEESRKGRRYVDRCNSTIAQPDETIGLIFLYNIEILLLLSVKIFHKI